MIDIEWPWIVYAILGAGALGYSIVSLMFWLKLRQLDKEHVELEKRRKDAIDRYHP